MPRPGSWRTLHILVTDTKTILCRFRDDTRRETANFSSSSEISVAELELYPEVSRRLLSNCVGYPKECRLRFVSTVLLQLIVSVEER